MRVTRVYPAPLPDLFRGEQIVVAGRYSGKGDGAIRLEGTESGSLVTIDGELKASIPLIGGKIESWAGGEAADTLRKEHEFGVTWLATRS